MLAGKGVLEKVIPLKAQAEGRRRPRCMSGISRLSCKFLSSLQEVILK